MLNKSLGNHPEWSSAAPLWSLSSANPPSTRNWSGIVHSWIQHGGAAALEIIVVKCWIKSTGPVNIIDRLVRTDSWTEPRGNRTRRRTEPSERLTGRGFMLKCPTHELALESELLVWQVGDDTDGARTDHRAVRRGQHPPCAALCTRDRGAAPRDADLHGVRRWASISYQEAEAVENNTENNTHDRSWPGVLWNGAVEAWRP